MKTFVGVVTAAGLLCIAYAFRRAYENAVDEDARERVVASTVRTCAALAWPLVVASVVPKADLDRSILQLPIVWIALVWFVDAYLMHHADSEEGPDVHASLKFDASSLTSLSFGISAMLGARPDGRYTHLFMYAIMGCFAFVLPRHNVRKHCLEAVLIESVQKALTLWCMGLFITGVVLSRASTVTAGAPPLTAAASPA